MSKILRKLCGIGKLNCTLILWKTFQHGGGAKYVKICEVEIQDIQPIFEDFDWLCATPRCVKPKIYLQLLGIQFCPGRNSLIY